MKNLLILLFIAFFAGCNSNRQEDIPENLIPGDTMVMLLIDLHVAQAHIQVRNLPLDSSNRTYRFVEEEIFDKYNLDRSRFDTSYTYYTHKVEAMDTIYSRVIDSLALREAEQNARKF